jgi:aminopeptidase-like protein
MTSDPVTAGDSILRLVQRLWPICRSITGPGVRATLQIIREHLANLVIHEVPTGTPCYDWTVPKEWSIRDAYVLAPDGRKIIDFAENNLHVVSYSVPVDLDVTLEELQSHLHSIPEQPNAIPYVTSYYKEAWGFCLAHSLRERLVAGTYKVRIDSELKNGSLSYGELILPGRSDREILFSTYVCHPSLANNELSGPAVATALAAWLTSRDRRYTYRFAFVPETIGAVCYVSRHLEHLKRKVAAGFVITCAGDERAWSFMPSRGGNTLSDRAARHVLRHMAGSFQEYSFLERGSDERQYCSPGVDLPVSSIMRSKYGTYPEYHTSLDNLELVTARGLGDAFAAYQAVTMTLEADCTPRYRVLCEPMMGRYGLRPTMGKRGLTEESRTYGNILAYADGQHSLLEIADILGRPIWELRPLVDRLIELDLLTTEDN